jgi:hypothetical protein
MPLPSTAGGGGALAELFSSLQGLASRHIGQDTRENLANAVVRVPDGLTEATEGKAD